MEKFADEFRKEVDGLDCPKVDMSVIMQGHQRYMRHKKHYKTISMCLIAAICVAGSSVAVPAGVWTVNHLISNNKGWVVKGDGGYVVSSDKKSNALESRSDNEYQPEKSSEDNAYSDIQGAVKDTGLDLPDIFKGSSMICKKVRITDYDEKSYQLYAVYADGGKKVDVSIDYGEGITGDTILPYKVKEEKWITTRDGSRVLMQSGSGKDEISCATYLEDYIISMDFENCTVEEAEAILEEADLSDMK